MLCYNGNILKGGQERTAAASGEERRPGCTPDDVTSLLKPEWWVYLNRDGGAHRSNRTPSG